jgi:hypothetical protein
MRWAFFTATTLLWIRFIQRVIHDTSQVPFHPPEADTYLYLIAGFVVLRFAGLAMQPKQ